MFLAEDKLELDVQGRFTGGIIEPLCYGAGKVERTTKVAEREGFKLEEAAFYSDSITDLPLLQLVERPVVINPDPRLRRVALQRGWPIELW